MPQKTASNADASRGPPASSAGDRAWERPRSLGKLGTIDADLRARTLATANRRSLRRSRGQRHGWRYCTCRDHEVVRS